MGSVRVFEGVGVDCRGLGGACGECEGVWGGVGVHSSLKLYVAHFNQSLGARHLLQPVP